MGEPSFEVRPSEKRLDSWKEIAAYLNRDVTTVQRWEKREGMPVHRHVHDKRGSVYALASELDAWVQTRGARLEENQELADAAPTDTQDARVQSGMPRGRRWVALIGAIALGLPAMAYLALRGRPWRPTPPRINSLAVLPLKNLSGDPTQEYLADGMTEALIGRLAGIHDLRVISRTSVMGFKDTKLSAPEIAKKLQVDALVEGSVIREGSRIRVHAQLIRAATDEHFWSETYDRELPDALTLESEVAQSIAEKVKVTVTGQERQRLAAARLVSPEVYESYLKGQFALDKSDSKSDIEQSIGNFEKAIQKDPAFAPAYLGLAIAYNDLGSSMIGVPGKEVRPKALGAARKALELDPELAGAHVLLGDMLQKQWQWADAEAEYRRALELNPSDPGAHDGLARWLLCQGRMEEALQWAQRGRALDPLEVSGDSVGWILFNARRYDEAIQEFRSVLAVRPDEANALWSLGIVLIANHELGEAIRILEKALSVSERSPGIAGVLVAAYAQAGQRANALRLLAELRKHKQGGYAGALVYAYLGLGDRDQAFAWLEQAYQEQSNIMQWLKVNPLFDPVRDDARFKDLVRRVGLS